MVKKFLEHVAFFNDELDDPNTIMEFVGLPSGQYFEVKRGDYNKLRDVEKSLVTWSEKLQTYTYRDKDYMRIIYCLGEGYAKPINRETSSNELFIIGQLEKFGITNYEIKNEIVDVHGNVEIYFQKNMKRLPFKFGKVSGNFEISNAGLEILDGCPTYVGGDFDCSVNNLQNLSGGPKQVKGNYNCQHNRIIDLIGAPMDINDNFDCSFNKLRNLLHGPAYVGGSMNCSHNQISTLKDSPIGVDQVFNCSYNRLTNLKGLPRDVEKVISDHNDFPII